jgi:hypothetical protein
VSRALRAAILAISLVTGACATACTHGAIEWRDALPLPPPAGTTDIDLDLHNDIVPRAAPSIQPPRAIGRCAGSVRLAHDRTGDWYATWWSARADSTAVLVVSRSADGTSWTAPVRVDTTDVGRVGCDRPPPAIAANSGVVHVVYAMTAPEGPGIFASHAMDHGLTFHSPVAVVYGEHIGLTAVAARGNLVAVAYEDPNTSPQRIAVAFSRTMGHPFQERELVSPPIESGRDPRVALGDSTIAVTWTRGSPNGEATPRMLRIGVLR